MRLRLISLLPMAFAAVLVSEYLTPAATFAQSPTASAEQSRFSERVVRDVAGWKVYIHPDLLKQHAADTKKALVLLRKQLQEIVRKLPKPAVEKLRTVPLYFSPVYPGVQPRAEFHPGAGWLSDNGRDPEMAKGIEFTNITIFEAETVRMPNFAMHELAHEWHDLFLPDGFQNADVIRAFDSAKSGGRYDRVERFHGVSGRRTTEKAYAMTNPMEYFAEGTEACFSRNDYFPYDRGQFVKHDPDGLAVIESLWGVQPRGRQ
ncbi:MAG: hypothetical protein R3C49_06975 [Planctomycetaceae bacterium]